MIRQGFVGCGRFSSPRICLAPWQGRQWQCLWYHVPESRNCHEGPHPLEFQLDNLVSSARSLVGVGGICGYCFLCFSWCYYALFLSCFFTILKKWIEDLLHFHYDITEVQHSYQERQKRNRRKVCETHPSDQPTTPSLWFREACWLKGSLTNT
jgi:hypothetical protein